MKIQFDQEGMFRYRGVHRHARNLLVFSQPCSMKFLEEVGSADERGTKRKKKQALFFSGNRGTRRKKKQALFYSGNRRGYADKCWIPRNSHGLRSKMMAEPSRSKWEDTGRLQRMLWQKEKNKSKNRIASYVSRGQVSEVTIRLESGGTEMHLVICSFICLFV